MFEDRYGGRCLVSAVHHGRTEAGITGDETEHYLRRAIPADAADIDTFNDDCRSCGSDPAAVQGREQHESIRTTISAVAGDLGLKHSRRHTLVKGVCDGPGCLDSFRGGIS